MDKLYYCILHEQQQGPFTLEELLKRDITLDTPIWAEGMPDWKKASQVFEVARHLRPQPTTPPPSYTSPSAQRDFIVEEYKEPCPPSYLVWSVLITLFCCQILGIFAIISSAGVQSAYRRGDYQEAKRKSKRALGLIVFGAIFGFIFSALYLIFTFALATEGDFTELFPHFFY